MQFGNIKISGALFVLWVTSIGLGIYLNVIGISGWGVILISIGAVLALVDGLMPCPRCGGVRGFFHYYIFVAVLPFGICLKCGKNYIGVIRANNDS